MFGQDSQGSDCQVKSCCETLKSRLSAEYSTRPYKEDMYRLCEIRSYRSYLIDVTHGH